MAMTMRALMGACAVAALAGAAAAETAITVAAGNSGDMIRMQGRWTTSMPGTPASGSSG